MAAKCVFAYKVRCRYSHTQAAICLNSAVVVRRSGSPAAGVGLRDKCNLVPSFSRALSFFRFSQEACSLAARNIICNCGFPVGRSFSFPTAGRPSQVWVGRKTASLQHAPVRAACCRGLRVRCGRRRFFFSIIQSHACLPSGQPFFSGGFRLFRRRCMYILYIVTLLARRR